MSGEQTHGPLAGLRVSVPGTGAAAWHAARMLAWLGATPDTSARNVGWAADWAASGAMALTGLRDGPPLLPSGQAASAVRGALLALECLARLRGQEAVLPGAGVLSERAAIAGLRRNAPRSAGGAFQLLRAADGWVGINLARQSDAELMPAWLGQSAPVLAAPVLAAPVLAAPVLAAPVLAAAVACRTASELADRARVLGLAAAALPAGSDEQLAARGQVGEVRPFVLTGQPDPAHWTVRPMLVVDLSSLWAGPLCGHLLGMLGARVVKVESISRPDGARFGPRAFYDLLHAGQESVALDFGTAEGRAALAGLIGAADVVIEGSRPRALRQLGIDVEDVLASAQDKCWVSITAYGRTGPWANAAGFGDDTALAAGLIAFDPETGIPAPCGDAIADPVTGVNAALVALACCMAGGTWLADLALREQVAATMIETGEPGPVDSVAAPACRRPAGRAPDLGADTSAVLAELRLP